MDQKTLEKNLFSMVNKPKTQAISKIDQSIIDKLLDKKILEKVCKTKPIYKSRYRLTKNGMRILKSVSAPILIGAECINPSGNPNCWKEWTN